MIDSGTLKKCFLEEEKNEREAEEDTEGKKTP
jgi:hypothetical protein